ncbi:MAG: acyltransferase [Oscillospiraceae bacterium]
MSERKNFGYISNIKTISLVGVVLFHCMLFYADNPFFPESADFASPVVEFLCNIFDASLIASFVFCSGFLYAYSISYKKRTLTESIIERAKRLIIPYYLYGAFWVVPLYTFFNINTFGRPEGAGYLTGYKFMLLGCFADHLWFLWMLFWVSLIFILMKPLLQKKYLPAVFLMTVILSLIDQIFLADVSYFKISQIAPYLLCFFFGIVFYFFLDKIEQLPVWAMFLLSGLMLIGCLFYGKAAEIHFALGWLCKISSAFMTFFLFLALERIGVSKNFEKRKLWQYTAKHSMQIYLLNCPFMYLYFRLLYPIIGQNVFLCVLINFVLCMLSLYIAVWIQDTVKRLVKDRSNSHAES